MKILIPTDFSEPSKVAIQYAVELAKKLNGELLLFHVVDTPAPPQTMASVHNLERVMLENAEDDMARLEREISGSLNGEIKLTHKVQKGYPVQRSIAHYAREHDVDLIVIGTKGASGLKKVLMGSQAAAMINASEVPVISVPENATFEDLDCIVYATDMDDPQADLETLVPFARLFDAELHVLYIAAAKVVEMEEEDKIAAQYRQAVGYPKINVHITVNEDITAGIDAYIAKYKANMLAMFTHKLRFFEKVMGKSVTREMAFHSTIPILSMKK